jgi:hypothetical protein
MHRAMTTITTLDRHPTRLWSSRPRVGSLRVPWTFFIDGPTGLPVSGFVCFLGCSGTGERFLSGSNRSCGPGWLLMFYRRVTARKISESLDDKSSLRIRYLLVQMRLGRKCLFDGTFHDLINQFFGGGSCLPCHRVVYANPRSELCTLLWL